MKQVNRTRREALKQGSALGIFGCSSPPDSVSASHAQGAWNQAAFTAKGVADVVKGLGGSAPSPTKDVSWGSTPEIAENGAVVPIAIESKIPKTESISILVEKESEQPRRRLHNPRRHRPQREHTRQDGRDVDGPCADQGRRQVLRGLARNQGHPRRLRRLMHPPHLRFQFA